MTQSSLSKTAPSADYAALSDELTESGTCILRNAFTPKQITTFRELCLTHRPHMAQTRTHAHSYHLAGFHHLAPLAPLHTALTDSAEIAAFLNTHFAAPCPPFGLSDITINRSQHWHSDLLRGPYAYHLADIDPWANAKGPCVKALLYLQPGKSLRVLPGSHSSPTPLDDDALTQLANSKPSRQLDIAAGDVVMLDLRTVHRGASDSDMGAPALAAHPKILLSTVFGLQGDPLTQAMQSGNAERLSDWNRKHLT